MRHTGWGGGRRNRQVQGISALHGASGCGQGDPSGVRRGPAARGATQGIGWALNEEYVYDERGRLPNASLLDYRMPTALDLPMIDTVLIEVPNPGHPYGVRGVGESLILPPPGRWPMPLQRYGRAG